MEQFYTIFFTCVLGVQGVCLLICLVRSVIGPSIADRLISVNMVGTIAILMVCILALMLNAGYLLDIAVLYAALSFLAAVLLTKIFMGIYLMKKSKGEKENA